MTQNDYEAALARGEKKVWIGAHHRCAGCGVSFGLCAYDDSNLSPEQARECWTQPQWKYGVGQCPICGNVSIASPAAETGVKNA